MSLSPIRVANPVLALVLWLAALVLSLAPAPVAAQCTPAWLPGYGLPGVNGTVKAILPLPSGGVIVGGSFTLAGTTQVLNIAKWDGTQWSSLGSGFSHADGAAEVRALVIMPNGDLIVGGHFDTAGGVTARNLARWNGQAWSELGGGANNYSVNALLVLPNGDLLVGGGFTTIGTVPAKGVARWNGTTWAPLGQGLERSPGFSGAGAFAFALESNGNIVVGGAFDFAGGVSAANIARWNGTTWSPIDFGVDSTVFSLAILSEGEIVAGGQFASASGTASRGLAVWNGVQWLPLVSGALGGGFQRVFALTVMPNGDLIAGGDFTYIGGVAVYQLGRWNGSTWAPVGGGRGIIPYALVPASDGSLLVGGDAGSGGSGRSSLQAWDGQSWNLFGRGFNGQINALTSTPDGGLIAAGNFTHAGAVNANRIAKWNGVDWIALGTGLNGTVDAVAIMPNGDVIAGGEFSAAGAVQSGPIARWNGTTWSSLGALLSLSNSSARVLALAVMPNGDLIAGGYFDSVGGTPVDGVARWTGTTWQPMLGGGFQPQLRVSALAVRANGQLIAGTDPAVGIFEWNGATWQFPTTRIEVGPTSVYSLLPLPNGDVLVGGSFGSAGGVSVRNVARWNGSTFSSLGQGLGTPGQSVRALLAAPGGDIFAAGYFTQADGFPASHLARWDGSSWHPHASGTDAFINALALRADGLLAAGGTFNFVGQSLPSYYFGACQPSALSPPLAIMDTPSTARCSGAAASFAVHTISEGPLTYAWRKDTIPINASTNPSAATPTLILANLRTSDSGIYDCVVSNSCGSITTNSAALAVLPPYDPSCNAGPACDPDLNQDGVADQADIDFLINAIAGGGNPNNIDTDFNHDGASDQTDVDALINVVAGGQCP